MKKSVSKLRLGKPGKSQKKVVTRRSLAKAPKAAKAVAAQKVSGSRKKAQTAVKKAPLILPPEITNDRRILVIDIGGSNVKLMLADQPRKKFNSRPALTPRRLVSAVLSETKGWKFDAISIGFPAPVEGGKILHEPHNLGKGWMRFNLENALGKPVKIINDAAMQAMGSYAGGRMLFLGLGTGLGSALVHNGTLIPLELCEARFSKQLSLEDVLGKRGCKRTGLVKWEQGLKEIIGLLRRMFMVDYIVLGGGNVKKLGKLPEGTRPGNNNNAFAGGVRMWSAEIEAVNKG